MSGSDDDNDSIVSLQDVDLTEEEEGIWEDRGGHRLQPDSSIDYELSGNVVYDLVKYIRSNTIKNEQQFVLVTLGYLTGYFGNPGHFVSGVLIGTSSSGKTHVQEKVEDLFHEDHLYQATTGSSKSLIYDGDWDDCYIASLDELQKPSQDLIEFLKSCFTPDTDVMTPTGVVNIRELSVGDEVYSINPETEDLEVKKVVDTVEKGWYEGDLVEFDGDNISLQMTPDHKLMRYKGDDLVVQTADDLADMSSFRMPVHNAAGGDGVSDVVDILQETEDEYPVVTDVDGTEYVTVNESSGWVPRYVDRDDWIQLIGWYVTEGCCRSSPPPYQVQISQDGIDEISDLLDRMNISYSRNDDPRGSGDRVVITNKILHTLLKDCCGRRSSEKRLPDWVSECSVERKELLFDTLMAGDGSKDGHTYYTTSKQLRDDVLNLITEIGRMPSYSDQSHVTPNSEHYWNIHVTDNRQWVTKESNIDRIHTDNVEGDGVYCVEVEDNHTLLAGRNGKFSHTRNCHSDDSGFQYKLTPDSAEERENENVKTIERMSKPYWFLYAQFDMDFELSNRMLKIPVHESEPKNRAVGAMSADRHHIQIGDDDVYNYDFVEGTKQLQHHIMSIPGKIKNGHIPDEVILPNVSDGFEWDLWDIIEPIYNHKRSESNRIYDMVHNLIRASALLNHHNRDVVELKRPNRSKQEYLVAEPQDVANVLACRQSLMATTHELDERKWEICHALEGNTGPNNEGDMSVIIDGLRDSDASLMSRNQLRANLEKLHENYLVEIHPGAADGGNDSYQFHGWDELGFSRILENESLFEETFDPVSGENFISSHETLREELEMTGKELTQGAETEIKSNVGGQQTLAGERGVDVDLEPHEEIVRAYAKQSLDGERVRNLDDVSVEDLLGIDKSDPSQTPLDPDHSCWDHPGEDDDWIELEKDARREIKQAIRRLIEDRVIVYDEIHKTDKVGDPVDVTFAVLDKEDL